MSLILSGSSASMRMAVLRFPALSPTFEPMDMKTPRFIFRKGITKSDLRASEQSTGHPRKAWVGRDEIEAGHPSNGWVGVFLYTPQRRDEEQRRYAKLWRSLARLKYEL